MNSDKSADYSAQDRFGYPSENPPPYMGPPPPGPSSPYGPTVVQVTIVPTVIPTVGHMVVRRQILISPKPAAITCPSCNVHIITRVEARPIMRTHLLAALLCFFGCWPCVCIPYCMDSCNNADHYCQNCNAYIGSYIN